MYNPYEMYPCPYYDYTQMYREDNMYEFAPCPYFRNAMMYDPNLFDQFDYGMPYNDDFQYDAEYDVTEPEKYSTPATFKDYGPEPLVLNIDEATKQNKNFRTAIWTGNHFQLTLMSINVGDDIGLEIHPNVDQFLRIEEGQGIVRMGKSKDNLDFQARVSDDFAVIVPAGTWHDIINTGNTPMKVYSIYAPPQHPHGTVHVTKKDAQAAEESHEQ